MDLRAYPIIIIFSSVINSLITSTNEGYILSLLILITNFFNHFMKEYIFRPIMGKIFSNIRIWKKTKRCNELWSFYRW